MRLTLRIENLDHLPDGGPLDHVLTQGSFSAGRDGAMDWRLPDPTRLISSRHFEVALRDGTYWLHDLSTNGTFLVGQSRRIESPFALSDGDRLQVGHYIIAVIIRAAEQPAPQPAWAPPAAGAFGAAPGPVPGSAAVPGPAVGAAFGAAPAAPVGHTGNPGWGPPAAGAADGWPAPTPGAADGWNSAAAEPADPWSLDAAPASPHPAPAASPPGASFGAPAPAPSSDPAASPFGTPQPPAPSAAPSPFGTPQPSAPSAAPSPFGTPQPSAPSAAPSPFGAHGAAPAVDGGSPFGAAVATSPAQAAPPAAMPAPAPPMPAPLPRAPAPLPGAPPAAPRGADSFGQPARQPGFDAGPFQPAPAAPQRPVTPPSTADQGLRAAICRGAGLPAGSLDHVDNTVLGEEIGRCLRIATEELMTLLSARASAKQFVKSGSRTMIGGMNNSPLKFRPNAAEAMNSMFVQRPESYLGAEAAFREGFTDIKRHQTAVYAAMQPALARLLEDLSPEAIEERVSGGIVTSRKSRAWDTFVERWDAKTHPFENGMLDVFLTYFAEAYDQAARQAGG